MASYTAGHLGFHGYMHAVDATVTRKVVISVFDLSDRCWRDACDDRTPPADAALDALYEEGWDE